MAEEASKAALQRRAMMYTCGVDGPLFSLVDGQSKARRQTPVEYRGMRHSAQPISDLHVQLAAVLSELTDLKNAVAGLTGLTNLRNNATHSPIYVTV